jgi:hypothetical protein
MKRQNEGRKRRRGEEQTTAPRLSSIESVVVSGEASATASSASSRRMLKVAFSLFMQEINEISVGVKKPNPSLFHNASSSQCWNLSIMSTSTTSDKTSTVKSSYSNTLKKDGLSIHVSYGDGDGSRLIPRPEGRFSCLASSLSLFQPFV